MKAAPEDDDAFAGQTDLLLSAARELLATARPVSRSCAFSVALSGDGVTLGALPPVASANLARLMQGAKECVAIGATLGRETDTLIAKTLLTNPALGAAIGAVASAYVDEYLSGELSKQEEPYKARSLRFSPRYSPGYGDLPLSYQRPLCGAMELWRIGIRLTEGFMMLPEKSVTALVAVREAGACPERARGEHACDRCGMLQCPYREANE